MRNAPKQERSYGLYWNRRGELYDVTRLQHRVPGADEVHDLCRIRNLSSGTESVQTCEDALDRHLAVGWFRRCTMADLAVAFSNATTRGAFTE